MGWTSGFYSRNEILDQFLNDSAIRPFRHCWVGNHLWMCYEGKDGKKFIVLALVERRAKHNWAYKDMDETSGPYYWTCPIGYLTLVPDPKQGSSTRWREGVIAYHERKKNLKNRSRVDVPHDPRCHLSGPVLTTP